MTLVPFCFCCWINYFSFFDLFRSVESHEGDFNQCWVCKLNVSSGDWVNNQQPTGRNERTRYQESDTSRNQTFRESFGFSNRLKTRLQLDETNSSRHSAESDHCTDSQVGCIDMTTHRVNIQTFQLGLGFGEKYDQDSTIQCQEHNEFNKQHFIECWYKSMEFEQFTTIQSTSEKHQKELELWSWN